MIQPLEIHYDVRGYDCGYGGSLKPFAIANFFQETAGAHAATLGIGMEDMWARGLTWMLSRIDIRIESMPRQGQRVIVRTWPSGTKRLFAQRCLELVSESGKKYAGAVYEYIIVEMATRRVLRPERNLPLDLSTDYSWPFDDLEPGIDALPFKALEPPESGQRETYRALGEDGGASGERASDERSIGGSNEPASDNFRRVFSLEARARHMDYNGHVNNAHFINWLCDTVPLGENQRFQRIKVDFVHEILHGETLRVWGKKSGETEWLAAITGTEGIAARGHFLTAAIDASQ